MNSQKKSYKWKLHIKGTQEILHAVESTKDKILEDDLNLGVWRFAKA